MKHTPFSVKPVTVSTGSFVRFRGTWSYANYNMLIPAFTGDFYLAGVLADQCTTEYEIID